MYQFARGIADRFADARQPDVRKCRHTPTCWRFRPDTGTISRMLAKAGYYTAYKGKWHLDREFDTDTPSRLFTSEMDTYGFSDFAWPGDVLAHSLGRL